MILVTRQENDYWWRHEIVDDHGKVVWTKSLSNGIRPRLYRSIPEAMAEEAGQLTRWLDLNCVASGNTSCVVVY